MIEYPPVSVCVRFWLCACSDAGTSKLVTHVEATSLLCSKRTFARYLLLGSLRCFIVHMPLSMVHARVYGAVIKGFDSGIKHLTSKSIDRICFSATSRWSIKELACSSEADSVHFEGSKRVFY